MESRFESFNGKNLMEMDLPPLHYTISTILPHGFFILAGGAKVGKSWLAEQISYAVAGGGQFWGYQAIQSEAFEFALEFDKESCCWNKLTRDESVVNEKERFLHAIVNFIKAKESHHWEGTATELLTILQAKSRFWS